MIARHIALIVLAALANYSGFSQQKPVSYYLPSNCDSLCNSIVDGFFNNIESDSHEWTNAIENFCSKRHFLDSLLKSNNLPEDFKYIPLTASIMQSDYSDSFNRSGYWGLSITDALSTGLKVNFVIDERRHFLQSSVAAVKKLKVLYEDFNDPDSTVLYFFLEGPAAFEEERSYAIAKWTIWKLTLNSIKTDLAQLCKTSKKFYNNNEDFVTVSVDTTIFFDCIFRFCKTAGNLSELNPVHYREIVITGDSICIPKNARKCFDSLYAQIVKCSGGYYDREKVAITYKVRYGDNLSKIARQYGVTVRDLMRWNKLRSTRIYAGQRLVIYVSRNRLSKSTKQVTATTTNRKSSKPVQTQNQYSGKTKTYIVKEGDTLFDIARRYNISLEKLMKVNNLSTDVIYPGQEIVIPVER